MTRASLTGTQSLPIYAKTSKVLSLANSQLSNDALETLFNEGYSQGNIEKLDLRYNRLSASSAPIIADFIDQQVTMTSLNLGHNKLNDVGVSQLSQSLLHHPSIEHLDFSDNHITEKGLAGLLAIFELNRHVHVLSLRDNQLKQKAATHISNLLKLNTPLWTLDCRGNAFGPEGIKQIALGLNQNTQLKNLNLAHVEMDDASAKCLFSAIENHPTLRKLTLSLNNLSDDCICDLMHCLQSSKLSRLDLKQNHVSDQHMAIVIETLENKSNLQMLDLRGNRVSDENLKCISTKIEKNQKTNQTIRRLYHKVASIKHKPIPEKHKQMQLISDLVKLEKNKCDDDMQVKIKNEILNSLMHSFIKSENLSGVHSQQDSSQELLEQISLIFTHHSSKNIDKQFFEKQLKCLVAISNHPQVFSDLLQAFPSCENFGDFTKHIHECALYLCVKNDWTNQTTDLKSSLISALNIKVDESDLMLESVIRTKLNKTSHDQYQLACFSIWHARRLAQQFYRYWHQQNWFQKLRLYSHKKDCALLSKLLFAANDKKRHAMLSKHFQNHKACHLHQAFFIEFEMEPNSFQAVNVSHVKPSQE